MAYQTFEDVIERDGKLVYTNVGDSMYPLIRQGDFLVIEKLTRKPKKYDIILYKRDTGAYVLHRILRVRRENYVICGDNRYMPEYGIGERHVIGLLTGLLRGKERISVYDRRRRLYAHLICDFFPIRFIILYSKNKFKKLKRKRKKHKQK